MRRNAIVVVKVTGVMLAVAIGFPLGGAEPPQPTPSPASRPTPDPAGFLTPPLLKDIYTADPSAHVFGCRLYVYPSHYVEAGIAPDAWGSHFAMRDYRVLTMDTVGGRVTVHDVALDIQGRGITRP